MNIPFGFSHYEQLWTLCLYNGTVSYAIFFVSLENIEGFNLLPNSSNYIDRKMLIIHVSSMAFEENEYLKKKTFKRREIATKYRGCGNQSCTYCSNVISNYFFMCPTCRFSMHIYSVYHVIIRKCIKIDYHSPLKHRILFKRFMFRVVHFCSVIAAAIGSDSFNRWCSTAHVNWTEKAHVGINMPKWQLLPIITSLDLQM